MNPVHQRTMGTGMGAPYGDCLKACVASVLDLEYESVPNFIDPGVAGKESWYEFLSSWLGELHGLDACGQDYVDEAGDLLFLPHPHVAVAAVWTGGYWIATVRSAVFGPRVHNGRLVASTHSIVMHGDAPAFDPLPLPSRPPYEFCGDLWFEPTNAMTERGGE